MSWLFAIVGVSWASVLAVIAVLFVVFMNEEEE